MMKTLQELYNEVIKSEELKKEFLEAGKNGKAEEFIKAHGCDVTLDEVKTFLENLTKADKELSVEELENAAGGTCNEATEREGFFSFISLGLGCWAAAIQSAVEGRVGQESDETGRLCSETPDGDYSINPY